MGEMLVSLLARVALFYIIFTLVLSRNSPISRMLSGVRNESASANSSDGRAFQTPQASAASPSEKVSARSATEVKSDSSQANVLQNYMDQFTGMAAMKAKAAPVDPALLAAPGPLHNQWRYAQPFELRVYLSASPTFSLEEALKRGVKPDWHERDMLYSWTDRDAVGGLRQLYEWLDRKGRYREIEMNVSLPAAVTFSNASFYLHAYVVPPGIIRNEQLIAPKHSRGDLILETHHPLITWRKRSASADVKSLVDFRSSRAEPVHSAADAALASTGRSFDRSGDELGAEGGSGAPVCAVNDESCVIEDSKTTFDADHGHSVGEVRIEQCWKPEVQIALLTDWSVFKRGAIKQMPPMLQSMYKLSSDRQHYIPPLFVNEFWLLTEKYEVVNRSVATVPLKLWYMPVGLIESSMLLQMDTVWESQEGLGLMQAGGRDELKSMLLDTNPYLLVLTVIVSIAHSVLEMLAFSSDIKHWRNARSMEGISVRTMFWNVFMQVVIFLYLLDSETSMMVLFGQVVGIAIELWKLGKAVKVRSFGRAKLWGVVPWFEFDESETYTNKTKEYDDQAMKYLSYAVYPLVACYAIYSLVYNKHRSWYSWVINSLVGAVYAFGFIMMFPQIFINYKLKSVAHLPLKAFMYKALNTVIDDLFSFIIKMPLLHRLACFRDDIVFVVFLYQRWIYPVDKTRINEFGGGGEAEPKVIKKKKVVRVVKKVVVKKKKTDATVSGVATGDMVPQTGSSAASEEGTAPQTRMETLQARENSVQASDVSASADQVANKTE